MKKILLAGASTYGVKNMGDDAMLYNLTQTLHKKIDCEITFLARHPEAGYDTLYGIRSIKNFEHDSKEQSVGRWFYGFNQGDPENHLKAIREAIEESDLIVIGGNSFMEVSASQFLRGVSSYSALMAIFAKLFQKPYVLYGVAGHPLKNEFTKELARFLCGNAELVTIRENFFKQILIDAGASPHNLEVFGDPAFGIDPITDVKMGQAILEKENIHFKSPNVFGISFRHMYWEWDEQFEQYSRKMADFCDFMVEELQADLLFIPNCTYNVDTPYEDDRYIAEFIYGKMKNKANAHVVKGDLSLLETLALYQQVDIVVSNRRHSCIFGAVYHKPVFAMSSGHLWHFKPFMQDLNIEAHCLSFTEETVDTLKTRLEKTWQERDAIIKTITKTLPALRDRARSQIGRFIQIMENR